MKFITNNKKIVLGLLLVMIVEIFSPSAVASGEKENAAMALINHFTISDINQLYSSCGNADSRADVCAEVANKSVQAHFKNIKPITPEDVRLFWKDCYDKGDNKLCAKNITYILKTHMPSNTNYTVSEGDISQIKNASFISPDADYSSLLKQVDEYLN